MDQKMVVLEGKVFTIELQSMLGSSGYGWCLSQLPKGIMLEGEERTSMGPGVSPTMQRFYFGVSSAKETEGEIVFALACTFEPVKVVREYKVSLTIIPGNSEEFVSYSENANALYAYAFNQADGCGAMNCAQPYGVRSQMERMLVQKPYGVQSPQLSCMDYKYPYGMQDATMKYGYPCGMQDATMKYGYPCGMQDATMKYGYPCGAQDATCRNEPFITKHGYPCR